MLEYHACRVRYKDLPKLKDDLTVEILLQTTEIVKEYIGSMNLNVLVEWAEQNDWVFSHPLHILGGSYLLLERNALLPASLHRDKTAFNLDASLNIFLYNGWAYVILRLPKSPEGNLYSFPLPDYSEDYSFRYGATRPEGVTRQQWRARRLRWEKLQEVWGTGLQHIVLSYAQGIRTEEIKSRLKEELLNGQQI